MPNSAKGEMRVKVKSAVSALVDGQQQQAVLVLNRALTEAVGMANKTGVAIVGAHNTSSSSGCLGYYVAQAAAKGYIAFCFAQSPPLTAPFGGNKPRFGTNPVAIGLPSNHHSGPITLDVGSSVVSFYALLAKALSKQPLDPGTGYDKDGKETTNAGAVLDDGAIFPRGVVGSGLAFVVEAMAGALVGAGSDLVDTPADKHGDFNKNWGHFLLLIDPKLLSDTFPDDMKRLVARVHSSGSNVYTPGQRGNEQAQRALSKGTVPLPPAVYKALQQAASPVKAKL